MCTVATSSESTMSLMSWLKKSEIDKPETEAVELTDTAELTTSDPLLGKPVQPSYQMIKAQCQSILIRQS